ncbi:hypothetical protein HGH93_28690 [Chitinophaga polysaccharea]|uniref:hypothetical protein n=1 Tax=Chitinophaga TaxID=79328 RepID=UPI0014551D32|nr:MULTISPECIES: hypothetical protein [Chitinophaga]NLR62103.1 hypothetical protein [Chitinophaga polysaccharea]NLU96446.1 hypothetical protein [Chitinophaga sp. Ak27]
MSYLNVLNGDAILNLFRQSKVPGEVVVCREMMCEGKVKYTKDLTVFFESRAKHLEYQYGIDKQTYYTNVVQELEKLDSSGSATDEIILWFEYDLFCQVNMIFLLHYINVKLPQAPPISIVDLPHHPSPEILAQVFEQRVRLNADDLALAADVWDAWCQHSPQELEHISKRPPGNLRHLPAAIIAHLKRFPDSITGLSVIESYFLLRLALGSYRWYDLYTLFWSELEIFGFTNFQLDILVNRMVRAGVLEENDQMLKITSLGKEILNEEENYLDYCSLEHRWLGGVRLSDNTWCWDHETQTLVNVER